MNSFSLSGDVNLWKFKSITVVLFSRLDKRHRVCLAFTDVHYDVQFIIEQHLYLFSATHLLETICPEWSFEESTVDELG